MSLPAGLLKSAVADLRKSAKLLLVVGYFCRQIWANLQKIKGGYFCWQIWAKTTAADLSKSAKAGLGELNLTYCLIYLDDVIVFSKTEEGGISAGRFEQICKGDGGISADRFEQWATFSHKAHRRMNTEVFHERPISKVWSKVKVSHFTRSRLYF